MFFWIRVIVLGLLSSLIWGADYSQILAQTPMLVVPSAHRSGLAVDSGVNILATNPESSWFATLGGDETLCIWNSSDGQFLAKVPAKGVQALAILPKSHIAALGDRQSNLRLMDVDTFETVKTTKLDEPVQWLQSTPDGRLFAVTYNSLYRLDTSTLTPTKLASFGGIFPSSVIFNDEGSLIALDLRTIGDMVDHLVVYSALDGSKRWEKDVPLLSAIAINGDIVAIGSSDKHDPNIFSGHILVQQISDGKILNNIPVKTYPSSLLLTQKDKKHGQATEVISGFSGGTERISLATGKTLQELINHKVFTHLSRVGSALIASGSGGVPEICDVNTLHCSEPNVVQGKGATQATLLPDGSLLLLDAIGNAIRIHDTVQINKLYPSATLALMPKFEGIQDLFAISRGDDSSIAIEVNNVLAPAATPTILSTESTVALAASDDGRYLAARKAFGDEKGVTVSVYDLSKFENGVVVSPRRVSSWKLASENKYSNDAGSEFQFGFTPDAKLLIAINRVTSSIHRYDIAAGKELYPVLGAPAALQNTAVIGATFLSAWAISNDAQRVVIADYDKLWSARLDGRDRSIPISVKAAIQSVVVGAHGTYLLSLEDGSVLRWDGEDAPTLLTTLAYSCTSLIYIQERGLLVANLADGSIHILDGLSGREEMSLALFANGRDWLIWTPGGLFDASDQGWRGVRWKFAKNTFAASEPVEDYMDEFYTPGLATFVLAGNPPKPPALLTSKERRTPMVRITAARATAVGKAALDVVVTALEGVSIHDLHLSRNGVLLKTWSGKLTSGSHLSLVADLVAGENDFTAYAFNQDNVKSIDGTVQVRGPDSLKRRGELYVIAIGVNEYKNKSFHLNYARQDAQLTAAVLQVQRKGIESFGRQIEAQQAAKGASIEVKVGGYDLIPSMGDAHVITLIDDDATREHILKALTDVAHQAKPEDAIIIYFAGHGVAVDDRYYLLPQDFSFDGEPSVLRDRGLDALQKSAISDLDLQSALAGEQAAVAALILDACQSGEVVGDTLAQRRGPMNSRGLAQMAYDKRMFILAASLSTQSAAEQEALEHGVLTYALVVEGLEEDKASIDNTPNGPSWTTLTQWLRWSANRVESTSSNANARGFIQHPKKLNANPMPIQQPRLFAPPDSDTYIFVASQAVPIDPKTLTPEGYTQTTASEPAVGTHPVQRGVLFQPSTLGYMRPGMVLPGGHKMLGTISGRIVGLDLDHGAVAWQQAVGGDLLSFDVSPGGEMVALDQAGNVFLVDRSSTPVVKRVVQGFGFDVNGLVRWLRDEGKILVVVNQSIGIYTREGTKVQSVAVPGISASVLSPRRDWLYLGVGTGKVLSYQLPSLTTGPVFDGLPPSQPKALGSIRYVTSVVVDPLGRLLLCIMNDGSFSQARLPSLLPDTNSLIQQKQVNAAHFSSDGRTLFVVDQKGTIQVIDTTDDSVKATWPGRLDHIDALLSDDKDSILVAIGNGGVNAWNLENGKISLQIPGGRYFPTARFASSAALDVMLANKTKLRTFHIPEAEQTSEAPISPRLYISNNWILGKSGETLNLWDRLDAKKSKQLTLAGEGQVVLTPDGRFLAWAPVQSQGGSIQVFDTATSKLIKTVGLPSPAVNTLDLLNPTSAYTLSADGRLLVYLFEGQLYEVPITDAGPTLSVTIAQAPCCIMKLSSTGTTLLLASVQGDVMLYDLAAKRIRRTLMMPDGIVAADLAPQTNQVIFVTGAGSVYVWQSSTTEKPRLLGSVDGIAENVAFNSSGSTFVVSSDRGQIGWFSLAEGGKRLATSSWLEATQSWFTLSVDGRFSILGDTSTPLGVVNSQQTLWLPAMQQPGFTPGLLQHLLER